jgi:predicted RNA-binding protein with PUA-like domain
MRDDFQVGDGVLFYHSNIPEAGIYGIAEVVRAGYPDATALDPKSKYHDPKAKGESPWIMVDVKAVKRFQSPVTRDRLQSAKGLKEMMVLKKGSRLSVQPVTRAEFDIVCRLGSPETV